MADYTNPLGQSQRMRALGLESRRDREERNKARLHAYRWLASEPTGQVILDDMALVLLQPCETLQDEGERRCILKIFKAIEEAVNQEDYAV